MDVWRFYHHFTLFLDVEAVRGDEFVDESLLGDLLAVELVLESVVFHKI